MKDSSRERLDRGNSPQLRVTILYDTYQKNLTYTSHGKQKGTDIEGRTEAQHSLALSV